MTLRRFWFVFLCGACWSSAPPKPEPPKPPTVEPPVTGKRAPAAIHAAFAGVRSDLLACAGDQRGTIPIQMNIRPSGTVSSVGSTVGSMADPIRECVHDVIMKKLHLPEASEQEHITYSLTF